MKAYHQLGHQSINLVKESLLKYSGVVCSPVNYDQHETKAFIEDIKDDFSIIFDPQLYFPNTTREKLKNWSYFPKEFDTSDRSDIEFWESLCKKLIDVCKQLECSKICSPCFIPKKYNEDYYKTIIEICNHAINENLNTDLEIIQSVIINYDELEIENSAEIIGSIITETKSKAVYLIINSNKKPREELAEADQICVVMKLIKYLKDAGLKVVVPFTSSDFLLWKYAGADICTTGKFFNLRRFSTTRFEDPIDGGGQISYWFEPNLLAYIRSADYIRLKRNKFNFFENNNPFTEEIVNNIESKTEPKAWLGLSWKKYLFDYQYLNEMLKNTDDIKKFIENVEINWGSIDGDILMEEAKNNGKWIRQWRIAIMEFDKIITQMYQN